VDVVVEDVEKKMFGRRMIAKSWKRKMEDRKGVEGKIMSWEVKVRLQLGGRRSCE
jgi:hypothetical protein